MITLYNLGYVFNQDKTKVFMLNCSQKEKIGYGKVNAPGGKLNDGECPEDSIAREFKEETGQEVLDWSLAGKYYGKNYVIYTYCSVVDEALLVPYDGVEGRVEWYEIDKLKEFSLSSNVEFSIKLCLQKIKTPCSLFELHNFL